MWFSEALSTYSLKLCQGASSSSILDVRFGLILIMILTNANKKVIPKDASTSSPALAQPFPIDEA